jgi:hypothetical protein
MIRVVICLSVQPKDLDFGFGFFTGPERNGRNSEISVLFGQIFGQNLTKI